MPRLMSENFQPQILLEAGGRCSGDDVGVLMVLFFESIQSFEK